MNSEKKIAHAILDAQKMHEESYIKETKQYRLAIEHCVEATCRNHGLSSNLWELLSLAIHWWNDAQLWAEEILAQ